MIQFTRRASLVVMLLLLASVGTASAECAWALWTYDGKTWQVKAPFETYKDCEADINGHREEWTRADAKPERLHWDKKAWRMQGVDYPCWPDTIDPRGPKGK